MVLLRYNIMYHNFTEKILVLVKSVNFMCMIKQITKYFLQLQRILPVKADFMILKLKLITLLYQVQ